MECTKRGHLKAEKKLNKRQIFPIRVFPRIFTTLTFNRKLKQEIGKKVEFFLRPDVCLKYELFFFVKKY